MGVYGKKGKLTKCHERKEDGLPEEPERKQEKGVERQDAEKPSICEKGL